MVSQIITKGKFEKMSNEKLRAFFLALQDNTLLQQNDLFQ